MKNNLIEALAWHLFHCKHLFLIYCRWAQATHKSNYGWKKVNGLGRLPLCWRRGKWTKWTFQQCITSPAKIHFWISDDVTKNGPWAPQYSHHLCSPDALAPRVYPMRLRVMVKWKPRNMWNETKMASFASELQNVQSMVVFRIPLRWTCLWLHANFRFVMNFLYFKKITLRN